MGCFYRIEACIRARAFVPVPFDADYLSVLPLCVETPDVSCPTVCALFVPVPHAPYA